MNNVNITRRIDEKLKKEAEDLFKDFGLSLNAAFNMFLKQSVREQKIPFEIRRCTPIKEISDEELRKVAKEEMEKHIVAFKELAK